MPQLTSLKINISATSRTSKAGEFCPFGILCPPLLQSVPRHACWQHYSYVSSGLYTREGVEVILGSSADVILLLFHCIVFTIDVLDLKSWSVIVFIVRLIFIGSYLPREPQEGKTEWLVLICLPFLDVKSRSLLLSCSHQLQSFLFSEVLWFFFPPPFSKVLNDVTAKKSSVKCSFAFCKWKSCLPVGFTLLNLIFKGLLLICSPVLSPLNKLHAAVENELSVGRVMVRQI